jgi:hypothetical protein
MKRHLWAFAQVTALLISQLAFAGGTTGGGNVVICKDPQTGAESFQLLDYYEAVVIYKKPFTIDVGPGAREMDKVFYVLQRLAKKDPERAKMYEDKAKTFLGETNWINKKDLPALNDYGHVPLDFSKCRIGQLAIQRPSMIPQVPLYTVRQEYWDQVSTEDRAGLILHEIIYGQAMAMGHKDSINSRYFNTLISSKEFESMSQTDYEERVKAAGLGDSIDNAAPIWLTDPVVLPGAKEGVAYMADLRAQVAHPKSDAMTFSIMSGPGWANVSPDGKFVGTPKLADSGENVFQVRVADTRGNSAEGTVKVRVEQMSHPPVWTMDPIVFNAKAGETISLDLTTFAVDPDGDMLAFTYLDPLPFCNAFGTGQMTCTPGLADVGTTQFEVQAADRIFSSTVTMKIEVRMPTSAPMFKSDTFQFDTVEGGHFWLDPYTLLSSKPTGKLNFSATGLPTWLNLTASAGLMGLPQASDVGKVSFKLLVSDGDAGAMSEVTINVVKRNQRPFPRTDLIEKIENQAYPAGSPISIDLSSLASDVDGDPLTFRILRKPNWVTLSLPGIVSGTPTAADVGNWVLLIEVSDGKLTTQFQIKLTVVLPQR